MNSEELQRLHTWFSAFCDSFAMPRAEDQGNIVLKQQHTREVCRNAVRIAQNSNLDAPATMLAEAVALFHDVGRFPQYEQFKTFDDGKSINHAVLGATTLRKSKALADLSQQDQDIILRAVALHNIFSLPEGLDEETLLYTRLVRDADKLDILRVFIDFFEQDKATRSGAVVLGLPDTPGYSRDVLSCLRKGEMAMKSMLRNQNDFKLLQLSWVYDLNFTGSFQLLAEQKSVRRMSEKLPVTEDVAKAVLAVRRFVDERLQGN